MKKMVAFKTRLLFIFMVLLLVSGCQMNTIDINNDKQPYVEQLNKDSIAKLRNLYEKLHQEKPVFNGYIKEPQFLCHREKDLIYIPTIRDISLIFVEQDFREALLELSLLSNIPIVVDESIEGLISANIQNKSFEQALKILLSSGGYSYKKMDTYVFVGNGIPENTSYHLLSSTCIYKPEFVTPGEIVGLLSTFYQPYITYSENLDYISVVAPKSMQSKIQSDILNLDRPLGQVLLSLTFVEVDRNAFKKIGLDWYRNYSPYRGSLFSHVLGTQVSSEFVKAIDFLAKNGKASVKAMPSVITMDRKTATFNSSHTVWMPLQKTYTYDETQFKKNDHEKYSSNRVLKIEYGINIKIRPHILHNNTIRLEILEANVSDLSERNPLFTHRVSHNLTSTVRIKNNHTLVLGGLIKKESKTLEKGIPYLMDVPFVGRFFKTQTDRVFEQEVMIMITPRMLAS